MRPRTASHLVLATLGVLWLAAVAHSIHYRDLPWLQVLFVDVGWLQALLLAVGTYGALMLLVGTLSRRPRGPRSLPGWPLVSVIVPAKNEEAVIEATVRTLCAMDYAENGVPRFEVIVVDDCSTDRTAAVLDSVTSELPIKVVRTSPGSHGKAAALNLGITWARGEVIAVFDADARVKQDFLRRTAPHLNGNRVGGVQSRRMLYNARQNLLTQIQDDEYRLFQDLLQRARRALGGMVTFAGNGLLLKRETLREVGGWNEDALTEDIDLSVRFHLAGWEIRYCEDAIVWEEAVPRLRDLIRQRIRWFEGTIRCLGEHLPAILFGRLPLFKRVDMVFFLGGALAVTLALLTTYLYALIDLAGGVVLYLQLPRQMTTWASVTLTAGALMATVIKLRWRPGEVALVLTRSLVFSLHRLLVVPLALYRYIRSEITGEMAWEKTAHGASLHSSLDFAQSGYRPSSGLTLRLGSGQARSWPLHGQPSEKAGRKQ